MNEIEQVYQDFWRPIIENEDGTIDMDAVKKELFDFHNVILNVSKVYSEITRNRFTKVNTDPEVIIDAAEEHYRDLYETLDENW